MNSNLEKNLLNLEELVKQKELDEQIQELDEYKNIFKKIEDLIINQQLVIYGGFALNELLPSSHKIYDEYELPDYDVYIPYTLRNNTNKKHLKKAEELGKLIEKLEIDNIVSLQQGHNPGTLKLFVNYKGVFDISFISSDIYNIHLYIYNEEKKKINKNLTKKFVINPIYLKMAFYQELGKEGSYFRWVKLYKRLHMFNKTYFNDLFLNPKVNQFLKNKISLNINDNKDIINIRKEVINYCKNKEIIVGGINAYLKYMIDENKKNIFNKKIEKNLNNKTLFNYDCDKYLDMFISIDTEEKINQHINELKDYLIHYIKNINDDYDLVGIDNMNLKFGFNSIIFNLKYKKQISYLFQLYVIDNECILYREKNKIKYIGEDGLIRQLYLYLMNNYENMELRQFYYKLIYNFEKMVEKKYKGKIGKRFKTQCIGDEVNMKERKKIGIVRQSNNVKLIRNIK